MKKLFHLAIGEVSMALEEFGFTPPSTQSPQRMHGVTFYQWKRELDWKTDYIRISYPDGVQVLDVDFSVAYSIIDDRSAQSKEHRLAAESVGSVDSPKFLRGVREAVFGEKVARLVRREIGWFDRFSSPKDCVEYVHGEYEKHPDVQGSLPYERALKYFEGLS